MNKDVIYVEPDDDITDIISKVENSTEKIVALVPPKKASVFRSIVNIKLISKAGATHAKKIVLVTTDPSIIKLAAATKLPVTKNLQSAPSVPELNEVVAETESTEMVDEDGQTEAVIETEEPEEVAESDEEVVEEDASSDSEEDENVDDNDTDTEDEGNEDGDDDENDAATKKAAEKAAKKAAKKEARKAAAAKRKSEREKKGEEAFENPVIDWIYQRRKMLSITAGIVVVLIIFGIWAFVFAPAATVDLTIKTTSTNFSEAVSFTTDFADEKPSEGLFYLEEKKLEAKSEVTFEATGQKNVGETAKGNVVVYTFFKEKGSIAINEGALFSNDGLSYTADSEVVLSWDRANTSVCENFNSSTFFTSGCQISARVPVTATGPGTRYNLAATKVGWTSSANVAVYTDTAISGGTDKTVTVVSQADVMNAIKNLTVENQELNRDKLIDTINTDEYFVIEVSFKETTSDTVATPAVGEEIGENELASLSVITTDSIYVVDKTKIREFVTERTKIADSFKIYNMNDPFIENFTSSGDLYVGRLKAEVLSGPEITENKVVEIVKGKGFGTAQHDLADVSGITSVQIKGSYPWVFAVPNDPNKITVNINTEGENK